MFWFFDCKAYWDPQLLNQGLNLRPLHWKAKSQPLDCQGRKSLNIVILDGSKYYYTIFKGTPDEVTELLRLQSQLPKIWVKMFQ